jgi:hypothetical protein
LTINDSAFQKCHNLTIVVLGEGVRTIGTNAFLGCAALKIVVLPASVQHVGKGAFGDCTSLQAFVMYNPNPSPTAISIISGAREILDPDTFLDTKDKDTISCSAPEKRFASGPKSIALTRFAGPTMNAEFPFRWGKAKAQSSDWIQLNAYTFSMAFLKKEFRGGLRRPQILPGQLRWLENWMLIQCRASINDSKRIKATSPAVPPELWLKILDFLMLTDIPNVPRDVLSLKGTEAGLTRNPKDHCRL